MTDSNGDNGRASNGRFGKGNPGGPGNPHVRRIASLRAAVTSAITPDDMLEVMAVLLEKAKKGDMGAIRELLDRTLGKPLEADVQEKIAQLEDLAMKLLREHPDWMRIQRQWVDRSALPEAESESEAPSE